MDHVERVSSQFSQNAMHWAQKCILIIDDDPLSRSILRLIFESEGYKCKETENGALGLAMLEQHQPDLVVTDHNMPVLTGLEFLDRLERKNQRKVPAVIVVTGDPSHEVKTRALQSGARAVLEKPYDIGEIVALTKCLINAEQCIALGAPSVN